MAKMVLFVRGPLSVTGGDGVEVIRNTAPEITSQWQDNPPNLSEETLMVQEPGSSGMVSIKALRERIEEGG